MEVIVLGTGCSSCKALYKSVEEAIKELNIEANLIKEEDLVKIMEYNVLRTPALVIDGKVVASGVKLSVNQAKELLTK
ncbi:MAG: thioredoxin family protein [Bacteroidales bacterium]